VYRPLRPLSCFQNVGTGATPFGSKRRFPLEAPKRPINAVPVNVKYYFTHYKRAPLSSVVRSKPAIRGHFKTGHMARDLDVVLCRSLSLQV
jgi:hypothetical protein